MIDLSTIDISPLTPEAARLFLILDAALRGACTDEHAKTITIHLGDAADACLTLAAIFANTKPDNGQRQPSAAILARLMARLRELFAAVEKEVPGHRLETQRPGFTVRSIA